MKQEYIKPEIKVRKIETECAMLAGSEVKAAGTVQIEGEADPTQPVESKQGFGSAWEEEF